MIEVFQLNYLDELIVLAQTIYDTSSYSELEAEFKELSNSSQSMIYVYLDHRKIIGFAQFGIRQDYVEGTHQSPCGYLEGICIKENYRKKGYGKLLVKAGEEWSRSLGCLEFASDCHIDNDESIQFHEKLGFIEASRNVHFVKQIGTEENN